MAFYGQHNVAISQLQFSPRTLNTCVSVNCSWKTPSRKDRLASDLHCRLLLPRAGCSQDWFQVHCNPDQDQTGTEDEEMNFFLMLKCFGEAHSASFCSFSAWFNFFFLFHAYQQMRTVNVYIWTRRNALNELPTLVSKTCRESFQIHWGSKAQSGKSEVFIKLKYNDDDVLQHRRTTCTEDGTIHDAYDETESTCVFWQRFYKWADI